MQQQFAHVGIAAAHAHVQLAHAAVARRIVAPAHRVAQQRVWIFRKASDCAMESCSSRAMKERSCATAASRSSAVARSPSIAVARWLAMASSISCMPGSISVAERKNRSTSPSTRCCVRTGTSTRVW